MFVLSFPFLFLLITKANHFFFFFLTKVEKRLTETLISTTMTKAVFESIFAPSISSGLTAFFPLLFFSWRSDLLIFFFLCFLVFVESGEAIILKVKRKLLSMEFSDTFIIFDLLEHLNKKLEQFEALTVYAGVPANEIVELISSFKHLATDSFHIFLDELKSTKQTQLPVDGTVHELTSNVSSLFLFFFFFFFLVIIPFPFVRP